VKFAVLNETSLSYKLLSLAWISSRTVVFLDVLEQAHVVDVRTADELEVVDLASVGLVYSTELWKSLRNLTTVGRALSQSGGRLCCESVASVGGQLIVLGVASVHVFSVRTWIERLNVLVRRRQFADALSLARLFYERTMSADESGGRQVRRREAVAERIIEVLAKYLEHVDAMSILHGGDGNVDNLCHVCIHFFVYYCWLLAAIWAGVYVGSEKSYKLARAESTRP